MSGSEELAEITEGRGRSAEEDKAGVCLGEACSSRDVTVSVLPSIKKPCHHLQGHFNSCVFERSLQSPESRCDTCVHACVGVLRDTLARTQVRGVRPAGSVPFMPDGRAGRPAGGRLVTPWAPSPGPTLHAPTAVALVFSGRHVRAAAVPRPEAWSTGTARIATVKGTPSVWDVCALVRLTGD